MEKWLGANVQCNVTGCVGRCTAVTMHITGRKELLIEFCNKSGTPCKLWVDEINAEEVPWYDL